MFETFTRKRSFALFSALLGSFVLVCGLAFALFCALLRTFAHFCEHLRVSASGSRPRLERRRLESDFRGTPPETLKVTKKWLSDLLRSDTTSKPKSDISTRISYFWVSFSGQKVTFWGHFWDTWEESPESRFLVTFELLWFFWEPLACSRFPRSYPLGSV